MRPAPSHHAIYDRRNLIRIIRRLHREKADLSWSGMRDAAGDLLAAGNYHFGSWRRAVCAAGINYKRVKRVRNWEWDPDRVREALFRCHCRGEALNYSDFERRHRKLLHIALYHFGTWRKALAAIGVEHRRVLKFRQWTPKSVIEEIRKLRQEGTDLSFRAMQQEGHADVLDAARYHLGSWHQAVERAGIDYGDIRKRREWRRETIIRTIRELHRHGDISWTGMHRRGQQAVVRAAAWYFRNWGEAVGAAGLNYERIRQSRAVPST
jgi:hypothetical protein